MFNFGQCYILQCKENVFDMALRKDIKKYIWELDALCLFNMQIQFETGEKNKKTQHIDKR